MICGSYKISLPSIARVGTFEGGLNDRSLALDRGLDSIDLMRLLDPNL